MPSVGDRRQVHVTFAMMNPYYTSTVRLIHTAPFRSKGQTSQKRRSIKFSYDCSRYPFRTSTRFRRCLPALRAPSGERYSPPQISVVDAFYKFLSQ